MTVQPPNPTTSFRCEQGHGVWRRDQLATRRGSIVCPIGIRRGEVCGLTMEGWKACNMPNETTDQLVTYDPDYDLSYIYLVGRLGPKSVKRTVSVTEDIKLDFDAEGRLIGIELLKPDLLHPELQKRSVPT